MSLHDAGESHHFKWAFFGQKHRAADPNDRTVAWHKAVRVVDNLGKGEEAAAPARDARTLHGITDTPAEEPSHRDDPGSPAALAEPSLHKTEIMPTDMRCLALISHNHMKPAMQAFVVANAGKQTAAARRAACAPHPSPIARCHRALQKPRPCSQKFCDVSA